MTVLTACSLAARLVLAGVFAVAGTAKLADLRGTRRAVVDFGVPERLAAVAAVIVPLAELGVAALLLPVTTAVAGAIGALVLLALFSGAIAVSLARGKAPDCHCFGQLHSASASWRTLARNGVFAVLAIFVVAASVAAPEASAIAWIARLDSTMLLALALAIAAVALLAGGAIAYLSLLRSYGRVLVRLDRLEAALASAGIDVDEEAEMPEIGLEPGTPAPAFAATGLTGEPVTLETLTATGKPSLLLFTSPRCGPCKTLLPSAASWQSEHAEALSIVFAIEGTLGEARVEAREFGLENVLVDTDGVISDAFYSNGTPGAVVVAPDGTIGSWVASGSDWVEELVDRLVAGAESRGLPVGSEPPPLELPALDGPTTSLASLRGRETLLLFWNPDCGFCRGMHEELLAHERRTNGDGPRLVVVSSGDAESTRDEGFRSLVLLDDAFSAGSSFGANGTPMAVLLDADGRIASDVVAGAEAVLGLTSDR